MPIRPRILADFEGRWRITRKIEHAAAPPAVFEGEANWSPDGADLLYAEAGLLQVGSHPAVRAERKYLWKPDLTVWFDDGRFFHQVPAAGGHSGHWCDPDQYDVTYSFDSWPEFRVDWQVRGPRKSYVMRSHYRRGDA